MHASHLCKLSHDGQKPLAGADHGRPPSLQLLLQLLVRAGHVGQDGLQRDGLVLLGPQQGQARGGGGPRPRLVCTAAAAGRAFGSLLSTLNQRQCCVYAILCHARPPSPWPCRLHVPHPLLLAQLLQQVQLLAQLALLANVFKVRLGCLHVWCECCCETIHV